MSKIITIVELDTSAFGGSEPWVSYGSADAATATGSVATIAGLWFGDPAADRLISACITLEANCTILGVTIGGVAAVQRASAIDTAPNPDVLAEIWVAPVPTGTSGNVVVTVSTGNPDVRVSTYRIVGHDSTPSDSDSNTGAAATISIAGLTIPFGGTGICCFANATDGTTVAWTNASEQDDTDAGAWRHSTALVTKAGTNTITADGANAGQGLCGIALTPSVQTFRFAEPTDYLPAEFDAIPNIASVRYDAAMISLGENLGQRASLTVTFRDHKHVMDGESFDSGTFWGKWRARYGQKLRGRPITLIRGVAGQSLEDMERRFFFVESTDGPTPDGTYTITAKDLLKFADDDRAQAPRLSNGRLAGSIDSDDAAAVLAPEGIGNLEYPASGHICLAGKEIVAFTRSGDNLTITRAQLGSPAMDHSAGDRAQLVLYYDGDDPADIISDLLTTYGGVDSQYIPLSEWQAETAANLGLIYARAITEPTAVSKLVSEIVEQAALAVWWDERARIVRLQVLKEIATDAAVFDEDVILEGSLKVKDQPSKRISQIWTYYGQRNPADRGDNEDNYRAALANVDLQSEGEYGGPIIRKITGKWVATITAAERLNQIQLSRFRDPPRKFNFDLFLGETISAGGGYRLRWRQNQDMDGAIVEEGAPIQVVKVAVEPGVVHVEAEEMLASGTIVLTKCVILTTTGSVLNWTVPEDWNDADNSIHCIGGGGGGAGGGQDGGGGGGGGAYSGITNLDLTPSGSVQYRVGSRGARGNANNNGSAGSDTWFNGANLGASSVGAKAGTGGVTSGGAGGTGGQSASGVGTVKNSGGNGGTGYNQGDWSGGGGGGGAAGPNGAGAVGAGEPGPGGEDKGGGGGGANGGQAGNDNGTGGNNRFGYGGGNSTQPVGQEGGGGKGAAAGNDTAGSGGIGEPLWTQTIAPIISAGPAGGGGAGSHSDDFESSEGAAGGLYGGGGGGGGGGPARKRGGHGAQGMIAIVWRPAT
jgi:hypothetical protein